MVEVTLLILIGAFCLFFVAALGGQINLGRLTIHPGWLAFTLWGLLAALNSATEAGNGNLQINVSLIFALGVTLFIAALGSIILALRARGVAADIHQLVNSTSEAQNNRIDQLTAALEAAGLAIPPRENASEPLP